MWYFGAARSAICLLICTVRLIQICRYNYFKDLLGWCHFCLFEETDNDRVNTRKIYTQMSKTSLEAEVANLIENTLLTK